MDAENIHAGGAAEGGEGESGGEAVGDFGGAGEFCEEGLAGDAKEEGAIMEAQLRHPLDEGKIVGNGLSKADSRIEYDLLGRHAAGYGGVKRLSKKFPDFAHNILIGGSLLHGGGLSLHVHEDEACAGGGDEGGHGGIAKAADVIDDVDAGLEGGGGDLGLAGIDGKGAGSLRSELPDDGEDAGDFLLRGDGGGAGAGGLASDVDNIRTLGFHAAGVLDGGARIKELAAVRKGIYGYIQDAHYKRASSEIETSVFGAPVHFSKETRQPLCSGRRKGIVPMQTTLNPPATQTNFPPFSLARLLRTVFNPSAKERVCILIDLPDPAGMKEYGFLENPKFSIQRNAYHHFYRALKEGVLAELGLTGGEMYAYQATGGSNLDLPDEAWAADGRKLSLAKDIYPNYKIILCISTYSATAPLTAFAKQYGFRGATLHGLNEIILNTGLAVDYNEVSRLAEKLRTGMTRADWVEIDFRVDGEGRKHTLRLELGKQEAQKSHGLCRGGPDVANLPAGEIYFVPTGAEGEFPMRYEDGTLGLMKVTGGRVVQATLIRGKQETISEHQKKLMSDPVTGEIGELGFGTQELPVSGRDIQDEKILGTIHVATGRSDHLGGKLTPDKFADPKNATHDDILFSPTKTPEITVSQARMGKDGEMRVLIEDFVPIYMRELLG